MENYVEAGDSMGELTDIEKLAIAQAFYKRIAETVKTKDAMNLRGRVDAQMRDTFEQMRKVGTAPKSFDIELFGAKVGTYSITTTKPRDSQTRIELEVQSQAALREWADAHGYLAVDMEAVRRHFDETGELPGGCEAVPVEIPAVEGGQIKSTTLRVEPGKVARALGPRLETVSHALLEGGE